MATKSRIQRWWDILRGKAQWGEVVDIEEETIHFGDRYVYEFAESQRLIRDMITAGKPAFLPRLGRIELKVVGEFLNRIKDPLPLYPEKRKRHVSVNAGVFAPTDRMLTRWSCETLAMVRDADLYVATRSVQCEYTIIQKYVPVTCPLINLASLIPLSSNQPWTEALAGKKVLVLHPFIDTIESQYKKRALFADSKILPEFELKTIRAVQSSAKNPCEFPDWYSALNHMKRQIDKVDFDVALIGAGAYAFFLAHHCKMIGKVGLHIGSAVQVLFGIKGRRWLEEQKLPQINEHWVFPADHERPDNAHLVEGGCYW